MDLGSFPRQINLTFGRRARRLHQDPACGGGAQEDETILDGGFLGHGFFRFVPPGSARTDEVLEDLKVRSTVYRQDAFITAPSMTTPAVTYFHSATSSFRAKATMVVFL